MTESSPLVYVFSAGERWHIDLSCPVLLRIGFAGNVQPVMLSAVKEFCRRAKSECRVCRRKAVMEALPTAKHQLEIQSFDDGIYIGATRNRAVCICGWRSRWSSVAASPEAQYRYHLTGDPSRAAYRQRRRAQRRAQAS